MHRNGLLVAFFLAISLNCESLMGGNTEKKGKKILLSSAAATETTATENKQATTAVTEPQVTPAPAAEAPAAPTPAADTGATTTKTDAPAEAAPAQPAPDKAAPAEAAPAEAAPAAAAPADKAAPAPAEAAPAAPAPAEQAAPAPAPAEQAAPAPAPAAPVVEVSAVPPTAPVRIETPTEQNVVAVADNAQGGATSQAQAVGTGVVEAIQGAQGAGSALFVVGKAKRPNKAWVNKFSTKANVAGFSASASKGAGQIKSFSGWGGSSANAEGSEGSITSSDFNKDENSWSTSWGAINRAKNKSAWKNDFSIRHKIASNAKSAHSGAGASNAVARGNYSKGTAQGSAGAATENNFLKNTNDWAKNWGKKMKNGKYSAFKQSWADRSKGDSSSIAIGHGTATVGGKAKISGANVQGEGTLGAQGSTHNNLNTKNWNKSWGVMTQGKKSATFQNNFANVVKTAGSTQTFGVGDAAIKAKISAYTGAKSIGKGQNGSGSNTDFQGSKNVWTNAWSTRNGKIGKKVLINTASTTGVVVDKVGEPLNAEEVPK